MSCGSVPRAWGTGLDQSGWESIASNAAGSTRALQPKILTGFMPVSPRELPIYELESTLVASLRAQGRVIVQAPTGSGKSTQLPQMLRAHGFLTQGEVVVL